MLLVRILIMIKGLLIVSRNSELIVLNFFIGAYRIHVIRIFCGLE